MKRFFVGVDLGTHAVKVVVLRTHLRGAEVVHHYVEPIEVGPDGGGNLEAAAAVAAAILSKAGLGAARTCVSVSGNFASYRALRFPFADARRVTQALEFELEDQFPVPLGEMHYAHVLTRGSGAAGRAFVVGIRRDRLATVESIFERAGVRVDSLTVGPAALAHAVDAQVVSLPKPTDGGREDDGEPTTLLVDLGHRTTEMLALVEPGPIAARSVRFGGRDVTLAIARTYDMTLVDAEREKRANGFVLHEGLEVDEAQARAGGVVRDALLPLVREIRHTIKWLETEHGAAVTRLLLVGAGSRLRELPAFLAERTGLDTAVAGQTDLRRVRGPDTFDATRDTAAVGAAMAAATGAMIDLHEGEGQAGEDSAWARRLRGVAMAAAAFSAAMALDTVAEVKAHRALLATRRAELATLSEQVFGSEVTKPAEIRKRLETAATLDPTEVVPERSALDVLAFVVEAAKPEDKPPPMSGATAPFDPTGAPSPATGAVPPTSSVAAATAGATSAPSSEIAPPPERGIVWADELVLDMVDVRELKVEVAAAAARSSAQDRFAMGLEQSGCLTNVSKGKVRDQNGKKVFEINMDNTCLLPSKSGEESR